MMRSLLFTWPMAGLTLCSALLVLSDHALAVTKFFVPPATASGDYDGDSDVDGRDFFIWQRQYGQTEGITADGDGSGTVDVGDLTLWQNTYNLPVTGPEGNWENLDYWSPAGVPGQFDGAIIHAGRTANVSTDVGFIAELRIGDTAAPAPTGGTLNINSGGKVTSLGQVLMGASNPGLFKEGELNLNGGTLVSFGAFFLAFEPDATQVINIAPGSLLDVNQNMIARFGTGTINQSGGIVDVQNNLTWGEGGDNDGIGGLFANRAEYNLMAGELKVGNILSIGRSPGDDIPGSDGRVNVSGGTLTASDLLFSPFLDEESILSITGSGVVRINALNYSTADANLDIADGFIIGGGLQVSTVNVSGINYTQIVASASLATLAIPEPAMAMLIVAAVGSALGLSRFRIASFG